MHTRTTTNRSTTSILTLASAVLLAAGASTTQEAPPNGPPGATEPRISVDGALVIMEMPTPSYAIDLDIELGGGQLTILAGKLSPDDYFPTATITAMDVNFSGDGSNAKGGRIEADLPTDDLTFGTMETLFQYDKQDEPYAELTLTKNNGLLFLQARGYNHDQTYKETLLTPDASIPYETTRKVGLRWWKSDPAEAMNGGVAVEVDGEVAACVTGLDNGSVGGDQDPPQEPPPPPGLSVKTIPGQVITLRNLALWRGLEPACTESSMLLAGGLERSNPGAWSAASGNLRRAVRNDREVLEILPLLPSWVVDRAPEAARSYQARFRLTLDDLGLAEGRDLTIFQGFDGRGERPFSLRLHREFGTMSLCADARSSRGAPSRGTPSVDPVITAGCQPLDTARPAWVELRWWSAAGGESTGGLRFRIRRFSEEAPSGVWTPVGEVLDLANAGQRIDEVWLGALDSDLGTPGALYVDGFESWR